MEFQKISSPSLRDLFVEQLEHLILSGKLKIGEKLPPERQLAEMMQVSRAVVNSGLGELERKGFSELAVFEVPADVPEEKIERIALEIRKKILAIQIDM